MESPRLWIQPDSGSPHSHHIGHTSLGVRKQMEVRKMATSLAEMMQQARKAVREIDPTEVAEGLNRGDAAVLVDVREPWEFAKRHIPGAVNIPRGVLELKADPSSPMVDQDLVKNRDARILLYCMQAPSARSILAAETLGKMGCTNVAAIAGGLRSWKDQTLPVDSPTEA